MIAATSTTLRRIRHLRRAALSADAEARSAKDPAAPRTSRLSASNALRRSRSCESFMCTSRVQEFANPGFPARVMRARAPDGNPHDAGRCFDREVLLKHEVEDLSLPSWENPQCAPQPIRNRTTIDCISGVRGIDGNVMAVSAPSQHHAAKHVPPMLVCGSAHDAEQPRPERGVSAKDGAPVENLEVRVLQHVAGLALVEPTTRHGPAKRIGVVPFKRRPEIDGRRYRRGSGFRNADECQRRRFHMTLCLYTPSPKPQAPGPRP